jgi:hypothetical protein
MKKLEKAIAKGEALAMAWNMRVPVGTPCTRIDDHGKPHETRTRSEAWVLGDGSPVVKVEGYAGGYMLDRIIPKGAP